ncbi:MAG: molecular chaperone TorD family protein [Eggerthellaceae bacterium]|nr:molecular chaperone TorD family protein [Eggerthellaceae bacterium]
MESGSLNEVFDNRTNSYRLFSRLFLKPLSAEEVEALAGMELEKTTADMPEGLLAQGMNDMGRGLHRRHTGTQRLLSTDWTMVFDGVRSYDGNVATPYASIFAGSITGENAILFQEPRAHDLKVYRAEGILADPDLHLPEDHLSFELSFMADTSERMAAAVAAGNVAEALRLIDVSEDFRANHILSWYPQFFDLAMKMVETRFYRGVLRATFGFLQLDGGTLAEPKAMLSGEGEEGAAQ